MIPAYYTAKDDRTLRGTPIVVYLHLLDELNPADFLEVKQLALCARLGISIRGLRNALNILVARGYLERQPVKPSEPRMYRLVYRRMP